MGKAGCASSRLKPASERKKPMARKGSRIDSRGSGFPRLSAHRGLNPACPENTVPAFAAAAAVGAHEVEMDLWLSSDGVPVVCHDPAVDRTTSGSGKISELNWEDIRSFDAGIKTGLPWSGIRVPRFEEALDASGQEAVLNVHIKDAGPGGELVRLACDALRAGVRAHKAYIACAGEEVLEIAAEYAPELERAVLSGKASPEKQIETAVKYGCARVQFGRNAGEADFRAAHEAGLVCNLFYSDEAREAMSYFNKGADVILANCVHRLISDGIPGRQGFSCGPVR